MKLSTATKLAAVTVTVALAAFGAKANITLAADGIGYIHASLNPTDMTAEALNRMITYYNGGVQPASTPGLGGGTAVYHLDPGSATPSSLLSVSSLGAEVGGNNQPSFSFVYTTGESYLIVQWDGPNGSDAFYDLAAAGLVSGQSYTVANDVPNESDEFGASGYWVANATTAPVPEPSTIVAGVLMLLPLGVGTVRALRKERRLARVYSK